MFSKMTPPIKEIPRVVIIGGGFGGLYTAQKLRNEPVQLSLIDRRNFHLFQPLLYQVATGGLSPADIASPLRAILKNQKNVRVLQAEVTDLDPSARWVLTSVGKISYDILVLACGSSHHYFGNPQWEKLAPGLKTIEEATRIRSKILQAFESAEIEENPDRRRQLMTFVIIGGGPTGIELAGALGEMVLHTLKKDFRNITTADTLIYLVEATDRILTYFPERLSQKALQSLEKLNVKVLRNSRVLDIKQNEITIRQENHLINLQAATILWAAGVKAATLTEIVATRTGCSIDKQGRIFVNQYCRLDNYPEIYVIGDMAHFKEKSGQSLPGTAPVAMQQGRYLAALISSSIRGKEMAAFKYRDKGNLAVIGRQSAVAHLGKLYFSGYPAWLLWLFVHLMYLVEFENKLLVFIQWAFNYFTRNRSARLIAHSREDNKI